MISIKGRSVFGSIARGKLTFYHRDEFIINKIKVSDPELEYKKYVKAKNAALVELGELYDRARLSVGEGDAQIFVIHQMLITDEQYDSSIRTKILDEHFNADYAVASTSRSFAEMLAQMDSEYMQSRAADVKDGLLALVFVRKLRSNVHNGRYAKIFRKYRSMGVHRTGPCAEALNLCLVHEQGF